MTLYSGLVSDANTYAVSLTVSLPDYPIISPVTKNFKVTIICEITALTVVKAPPANSTYKIQVQPYLMLNYLVTNVVGCPMTFTVEPNPSNVPFSLIIDTYKNQLVFETKDLHHAGVYKLKLHVDPLPGTSTGVSKVLDFDVELINICKTTSFEKIKIANLEILRQAPNFFQDNYIVFGDLKTEAEK